MSRKVATCIFTPDHGPCSLDLWRRKRTVGVLLWPLDLHQEHKYESFWYKWRKKVFSTRIFLQMLTTNEVQLFGVGLRGDPRMTESWTSQLFFKKLAFLIFNPKGPNSALVPLFFLYLLPPSFLPLNCSSSLVLPHAFLLFLLFPQLRAIFC